MGVNQSLLQAIKEKDYPTVATILEKEDTSESDVVHALEHGCENGDDRLVELAFKNIKGDVGLIIGKKYLLHKASLKGHLKVVVLLLESGAQVDLSAENGWSALAIASREGHIEVVKILLENGAEVNLLASYDWSALMVARENCHVEVVELLLVDGAQVKLVEQYEWSALMAASQNGHANVVKILLENGAHADFQNTGSQLFSALILASGNGHVEVVKILLEKGAQVDLQEGNGWAPLHVASERGHAGVVDLLLENGAQVNLRNKFGWSALMFASKNGHVGIVKTLLENGAQIEYVTKDGLSSISLASNNEVVHILQKSLKEVWSHESFTVVQISPEKKCIPLSTSATIERLENDETEEGRAEKKEDTDKKTPVTEKSGREEELEKIIADLRIQTKESDKRVQFMMQESDQKIQQLKKDVNKSEESAEGCKRRAQELEKELMELNKRMQELSRSANESDRRAKQLEKILKESEQECRRSAEESRQKVHQLKKRLKESYAGAQESQRRVEESNTKAEQLFKRAEESDRRAEQLERRAEESDIRAQKSERKAEELNASIQQLCRRAEDSDRRAEELKKSHDEQWVVRKQEIHLTGPEIGTGGWATVSVAEFRGVQVAVKRMHNQIVCRRNKEVFRREMQMAARLHHPNLVQFIGATLQGDMMIVMEYMPTSLRKQLETDEYFQPKIVKYISLDIARALNYLHQMQPSPMIHRDISSANVLLEPLIPPKTWKAKITDYGSVNLVRQLNTENPGSPAYSAPEAIIPSQQSPKMDIYSFGVLILEMLTGQLLAPEDRLTLFGQVHHEQLLRLIQRCLIARPDDRPNASDVISELS